MQKNKNNNECTDFENCLRREIYADTKGAIIDIDENLLADIEYNTKNSANINLNDIFPEMNILDEVLYLDRRLSREDATYHLETNIRSRNGLERLVYIDAIVIKDKFDFIRFLILKIEFAKI